MHTREHTFCRLLLLTVTVLSVLSTVVWLRIDTRPPRWDEAAYLNHSLQYHDTLTSGGIKTFIKALLVADRQRPLLVPALAVPAHLLLGRSAEGAFAVNLLAFVVMILAVYGLATYLVSPWCGLLAALFISTYPGILSLARLFLLDFAHTALVAVALFLLVKTEQFAHRNLAVALGVVMGLGLLCRAFSLIFLIGPLTVSVYAAWKKEKSQREAGKTGNPRWLVNGRLALLSFVIVAAPWYIVNFVPLLRRSLSAAYGAEAVGYGPSNPLTLHALLNYGIQFINVHLMLIGIGIFLIAVLSLWVQLFSSRSRTDGDNRRYHFSLLLSAALVPYLFFTTLPSQDFKNITPVLPTIAVLSAWGMSVLNPLPLRKVVIGCSVLWSLFQGWIGPYSIPILPQEIGLPMAAHLPPLVLMRQGAWYPTPGFLLPRQENWRIPEIFARMIDGSGGPNPVQRESRPIVVALLTDHFFFNSSTFLYFAALRRLPVDIQHPGDPLAPTGKEYQKSLLRVDFVVVKTGDFGPAWLNPYYEDMVAFLRAPQSPFIEVGPRFPLPDGSEAILYAVRNGSVPNDSPRQ